MGGIALKLISPDFDGVPDRLVLLPMAAFVELKAPGSDFVLCRKAKKATGALGYLVFCIDGAEQIGEMIDEILSS